MGKNVLVVDDEKDVLELIIEILKTCKVDSASSFEEAKGLLENHPYDIAVLDIMGVKGFELLKVANDHEIPALMLTAHARNAGSLDTSIKGGAAYFVPKAEIAHLDTYVADVLEAKEKGKNPWARWLKRLGSTIDTILAGSKWRHKNKEFLERLQEIYW